MRTRTLVTALLTLLAPGAAFAAAPAMPATSTYSDVSFTHVATSGSLAFAGGDDDDWRDRDRRKCGRGNAWGCRRDSRYARYDYDRRRDRDRWDYERRRRDFYRYDSRYRRRDRRYSRFDNQPVACLRAGGRAVDWAVVVVCLP